MMLCQLVGDQPATDKAQAEIDLALSTKKPPEATECVGITIREDDQATMLRLSQPDVISRIEIFVVEHAKISSGVGIQKPTEL